MSRRKSHHVGLSSDGDSLKSDINEKDINAAWRRKSHPAPHPEYDSFPGVDLEKGNATIWRRKSHAAQDSYDSLTSNDSEMVNIPILRRKSHAAQDSVDSLDSSIDNEKGSITVARRRSHAAKDSYGSLKSVDRDKDSIGSSGYGYVPELSHNYAYHDRASTTSSFSEVYSETDYLVQEINKHDDVELLSPWRRRVHRLAPLSTLAAVAAYFTYYAFRISFTVNAQQKYHKTYGMAWVFIATEFMVARKLVRCLDPCNRADVRIDSPHCCASGILPPRHETTQAATTPDHRRRRTHR
jgi:hypothetical protein